MKIEEMFKLLREGHKITMSHWGNSDFNTRYIYYDQEDMIVKQANNEYYKFGWLDIDADWRVYYSHGFYKYGGDMYMYDGHWYKFMLDYDSFQYSHFEGCEKPENPILYKEIEQGKRYDDYEIFLGVTECQE